jgi:hypothetical protein
MNTYNIDTVVEKTIVRKLAHLANLSHCCKSSFGCCVMRSTYNRYNLDPSFRILCNRYRPELYSKILLHLSSHGEQENRKLRCIVMQLMSQVYGGQSDDELCGSALMKLL